MARELDVGVRDPDGMIETERGSVQVLVQVRQQRNPLAQMRAEVLEEVTAVQRRLEDLERGGVHRRRRRLRVEKSRIEAAQSAHGDPLVVTGAGRESSRAPLRREISKRRATRGATPRALSRWMWRPGCGAPHAPHRASRQVPVGEPGTAPSAPTVGT